jgi:hypothetical protein
MTIYLFDVGQGDSQLIVFPSGFSILIDIPEKTWNTGQTAEMMATKLNTILGTKHINVAVGTHLHLDHIGYAGYGGFWALLEKYGFTFDKFVDRDSGVWADANGNKVCDRDTEIVWHNIGDVSATGTTWLCYSTNPANTKIYPIRETAKLCSSKQIAPSDGTVTVVTADALGAKRKDGTPVSGDHSQDKLPPSENDFAIGIVVRMGAFTYGTFGDLDGQYETSSYGYEYNDVESQVVRRVGQVDLCKVNHHGSQHSTNQLWVDTLKPQAALISVGANNSYGHPDQVTLDRLLPVSDVYLTENGNPADKYGKAVIANGDITITVPVGGTSFTITAAGKSKTYTSKNVAPVSCTP